MKRRLAQEYDGVCRKQKRRAIGRAGGAQLSQHHLNKLDAGLAVYYERLLSEIYMQIGGTPIPATLNAEQQTEFALGYYQQRAALYSNTSNAENKEKE